MKLTALDFDLKNREATAIFEMGEEDGPATFINSLAKMQFDNDTHNSLTFSQIFIVMSAVKKGDRIQAIKTVREFTRLGLKDSKDFVDQIQDYMGLGRI